MSDTYIQICKGERRLVLFVNGVVSASFPIGLGSSPIGPKRREGDGKTPEGEYCVCMRNDRSRFHLSLGLSYPNAEDAKTAYNDGLIGKDVLDRVVTAVEKNEAPPWDTSLGGEIMIHGGGATDWTAGCIAMEDEVMDFLWENVPLGTPIIILP